MTRNRKRLRNGMLGFAAAFAVYLGVGFLLVPWVVERQLVAYVERDLGHRLTVGEVRVNPLALTAEVRDLELRTPGGDPLLSFSRLFANLAALGAFRLTWTLDELTLERPYVTAVIGPDGGTNFGPLLEALGRSDPTAAQPEGDGTIPALLIRRIRIAEGRILFADLQRGPDARVSLIPLDVAFTDLATAPDARSPYTISAATAAGETLRWGGYLSLNPIASSGRLTLENWKLDTLARFVDEERPLAARGRLDVTAGYRVAYRAGRLSAAAEDVEVRLTDTSVAPGAGTEPLLAFDSIVFSNGRFDLEPRSGGFARVVATRPRLALAYAADGTANWQAVLGRGASPSASPGGTVAAPSAPAAADATPSAEAAASAADPGTGIGPAGAAGRAGPAEPVAATPAGGSPGTAAATAAEKNASSVPAAADAPSASPRAGASGEAGDEGAAPSAPAPADPPAVTTEAPAADGAGPSAAAQAASGGAPANQPIAEGAARSSHATAPTGSPAAADAPPGPSDGAAPAPAGTVGPPAAAEPPTAALPAAAGGAPASTTTQAAGSGLTAAPDAAASAGQAGGPWRIRIEQVEVDEGSVLFADARDAAPIRLEVSAIGLRVGVDVRLGATFAGELSGIEIALGTAEMRVGEAVSRLDASSLAVARVAVETRAAPAPDSPGLERARVTELRLDLGKADLDQGGLTVALAPSSLRLGPIEAAAEPDSAGGISATVDGMNVAIGAGRVRQGDLTAEFEPATLALGRTQASLGAGPEAPPGLRVESLDLAARLGRIDARVGGERIRIAGITFGAARVGATPGEAAVRPGEAATGQRLAFGKVKVEVGTATLAPAAGKRTIASVGAARASAGAVRVGLDEAGVETDALAFGFDRIDIRHPGTGDRLARAARARIEGVELDTSARRVDIARVRLEEAGGTLAFSEKGALNWEAVLALRAAVAGGTSRPGASATGAPSTAVRANRRSPSAGAVTNVPDTWRVSLKRADYRNVSATYRDARMDPPLEVQVQGITGRVTDIGTDPGISSRVQARARLAGGGDLALQGRVNRHSGALDLQLRLAGLPLAKAQPWLSRATHLEIRSGTASAQGRLRSGQGKDAPGLRYEGAAGIQDLRLDEPGLADPFFALADAGTSDLVLTLDPGRLEIGQLTLRGMVGKLLIDERQQVNLRNVLREPSAPAGDTSAAAPALAPPGAASAPAGASDAAPEPPPFPVEISRIRVAESRLQFADLSLTPQFAALIHELQGVISGLSTAPDARAQVELEGRVNEYGSATIKGAIDVFRPKAYTDLSLAFRNLEMKSITPYAAKFAGYRIAAGTLSAELAYRIEDQQLRGENKIVIDKLQLGEKVDSPSALDLPLELGIALLKDSRGVIDVGLPVRGDLANPQFDFGDLIGKAIGNLIVGIVTAPFRFLGALFGGKDGENLDAIAFEPGKASLQPPERQKLDTVAEALSKRPQLALTVKPTFHPARDLAALKDEQARREILARAGVALTPDEAPGPLDLRNERQRAAVEQIFVERFDFPALRDLRAAVAAEAAGKPAPTALAEAMVARVTESIAIGETRVAELGKARGEAIERGITAQGRVPGERIRVQAATPAEAAQAGQIVAALEIAAR